MGKDYAQESEGDIQEVSISSVFRYYIPFACIDPSFGPYHIIVISYFLSRKLMFHSGAANLPTDSGAPSCRSADDRAIEQALGSHALNDRDRLSDIIPLIL